MKKKTLNIILSTILLVLISLGLINHFLNSNPYIKELEKKVVTLKNERDSVFNTIFELSKKNKELELHYEKEINKIDSTHKTNLKNLELKYKSEFVKIEELPLTEQITLLGNNIGVIDSLPKLVVINFDSTIQIHTTHPLIINQTFLNLNFKNLKINEYSFQVDRLKTLNENYLNLVNLKNQEIMGHEKLHKYNQEIILNLETILEQENINNRKKILNYSLLAGAGGLIIGVLISK